MGKGAPSQTKMLPHAGQAEQGAGYVSGRSSAPRRVRALPHPKAEPVLPPAEPGIARPVLQQQSPASAKIHHRRGKAY